MKYSISDLNNQKPNASRLVALQYNGNKVDCLCVCGCRVTVAPFKIKTGHTKSCGCLNIEAIRTRSQKYSVVNRAIYVAWHKMIDRCNNPENKRYDTYGGRGVTVCDLWQSNYQNFLDWSLSNGWGSGLQIDKDILGNGLLYSPETCKWVTPMENANNRKTCKKMPFRGSQHTLSEISRIVGIKRERIRSQIRNGSKTIEEAIVYLSQLEPK